jgi:colicin import membrane protein
MMSAQGSYFIAAIASIGIHAAVIVVVLANWEPESKKTVIQPQYIEAELIELAPKKKISQKTKGFP